MVLIVQSNELLISNIGVKTGYKKGLWIDFIDIIPSFSLEYWWWWVAQQFVLFFDTLDEKYNSGICC